MNTSQVKQLSSVYLFHTVVKVSITINFKWSQNRIIIFNSSEKNDVFHNLKENARVYSSYDECQLFCSRWCPIVDLRNYLKMKKLADR